MEKLEGIPLKSFPLIGLQKVSDLIEYDGPVLSHFIDSKGDHYLYYWVDYDSEVNRWLVWRTSKSELRLYVSGSCTLQHLLNPDSKEFVYFVDIDPDLNYRASWLYYTRAIPEKYLPSGENYYLVESDEFYREYLAGEITTHQNSPANSLYLEMLTSNSIFFKMEPRTSRYGDTISFKDAQDFFRNIISSINEYFSFSFFNDFKEQFATEKSLNQALQRFLENNTPRLSYTKFGSFEVGLALDPLHLEGRLLKQWQASQLKKFKAEVIEADLSNEVVIQRILEEYPEEVRSKVFKPIIELRNHKGISIKTSSIPEQFINSLKPVVEKTRSRLVGRTFLAPDPDPETEFRVVYLELPKGRQLIDLKKSDLTQGVLFSEQIETVQIPLRFVHSGNTILTFKRPIIVEISPYDRAYRILVQQLDLDIISESKEAGLRTVSDFIAQRFSDLGYDKFDELVPLESVEGR